MSVFESTRFIPIYLADLAPVAEDLARHFQQQDYEVVKQQGLGGSWDISIHRGGMFKALLGMKTALKIDIEPTSQGTLAKAGVGIVGMQVVPTVISMLLFWPVLVTQIWGAVRQSKLDDQAMEIIATSLTAHAGGRPLGGSQGALADNSRPAVRICTTCGKQLPEKSRFCPDCGTKVA
jgi:hypothetical protein